MIRERITFRIDDCNYTGRVYDKVRSGSQDVYLVKLEKDDMDFDISIDTPDVMIVYPEDIYNIRMFLDMGIITKYYHS